MTEERKDKSKSKRRRLRKQQLDRSCKGPLFVFNEEATERRLVSAIKIRDYREIEVLLRMGANPDKEIYPDIRGDTVSPIHYFIRVGDLKLCKVLLAHKALNYNQFSFMVEHQSWHRYWIGKWNDITNNGADASTFARAVLLHHKFDQSFDSREVATFLVNQGFADELIQYDNAFRNICWRRSEIFGLDNIIAEHIDALFLLLRNCAIPVTTILRTIILPYVLTVI